METKVAITMDGEVMEHVGVSYLTMEEYNTIAECGARILFDYEPIENGPVYRLMDCVDQSDKESYLIMVYEAAGEIPVEIISLPLKAFYDTVALAIATEADNDTLIERLECFYNRKRAA